MKKQKKYTGTAPFFSDPKIKKIMSNKKTAAGVNLKLRYLQFLEDIERIRKAEGISQNTLAKMTKISQEEISRIERGKRNITFETYFRILESMGYEPVFKYKKITDHHV